MHNINLSPNQINILKNVIPIVTEELGPEFHTRVGLQTDEAQSFLEKLKKVSLHNELTLQLNDDEIRLVHNCMNEVLNGFEVKNFNKQIGQKQEVEKIYRQTSKILGAGIH